MRGLFDGDELPGVRALLDASIGIAMHEVVEMTQKYGPEYVIPASSMMIGAVIARVVEALNPTGDPAGATFAKEMVKVEAMAAAMFTLTGKELGIPEDTRKAVVAAARERLATQIGGVDDEKV